MTWVINAILFGLNDYLKYTDVFTDNTQARWIPDSYIIWFNKIALLMKFSQIKLTNVEYWLRDIFY